MSLTASQCVEQVLLDFGDKLNGSACTLCAGESRLEPRYCILFPEPCLKASPVYICTVFLEKQMIISTTSTFSRMSFLCNSMLCDPLYQFLSLTNKNSRLLHSLSWLTDYLVLVPNIIPCGQVVDAFYFPQGKTFSCFQS